MSFFLVEISPKYRILAGLDTILPTDSRLAKKSEKSLKFWKFSIFHEILETERHVRVGYDFSKSRRYIVEFLSIF